MDLPPTDALPCDPRHGLCIWCAGDEHMTQCPMCRAPIIPPTPGSTQLQGSTTNVNVYIQLRDRRLYGYRLYEDVFGGVTWTITSGPTDTPSGRGQNKYGKHGYDRTHGATKRHSTN